MLTLAKAKQITGSWPAASLLTRLQYWQPRTKIRRNGHMWVVMPRSRWMEETGCSLDEYKRALTLLKRLGFVATERHRNGKNVTTFLRLVEGVNWCTSAPTGWSTNAPSIYNTTYSKYNGGIIIELNSVGFATQAENPKYKDRLGVRFNIKKQTGLFSPEREKKEPPKAPQPAIKTPLKPKTPKKVTGAGFTVDQALAAMKAKKAAVAPLCPDKPHDMSMLWKQIMSEEYDTGFITHTTKQLGMLKHFIGKCPKGQASAVMVWALNNWIEFVKVVEQEAAAFKTPSSPKIEFLLQHAWIAVKLSLQGGEPAPKVIQTVQPQKAAKPVQTIAQTAPDKGNEQPQSLDELLAIISSPAKEG